MEQEIISITKSIRNEDMSSEEAKAVIRELFLQHQIIRRKYLELVSKSGYPENRMSVGELSAIVEDISKIEECIAEKNFTNVTILEGEARGVDRIAKEWALAHDIPVKEYPPDVEHYPHIAACHKRTT